MSDRKNVDKAFEEYWQNLIDNPGSDYGGSDTVDADIQNKRLARKAFLAGAKRQWILDFEQSC